MPSPQKRVCVIVPAYNEAAVIDNVIRNAQKIFSTQPEKIDIVIVNDGSKDDTSTIALSAGAIVVDHIINSGAGAATATGLEYAKTNGYDIAATMDADGQHDPHDVIAGVRHILATGADLAIGSRLMNSTGMSLTKVVGNKGLSVITNLLFGVNTSDSQSGLRIFSNKSINELTWKTTSYEFCSEMLWRARQLHLGITEYPIKSIYTDYSRSKGQSNWNAINIIKSLLTHRIGEFFR